MDSDIHDNILKRFEGAALDETFSPDATLTRVPTASQTISFAETMPRAPLGIDSLADTMAGDLDSEHTNTFPEFSSLETLDMGSLPLLETAQIPESVDAEFHIVGSLGEGGMGIVHHAKQRSLQRSVAFKCLKPGLQGHHQTHALLREAMFTGYLEHPNIVPVHQFGRTHDGSPAFVMKRIEGVSWRELLRDAEHPMLKKVKGALLVWHLEIFLDVCNAVAYAHDKGILHRDIKPENIMIGGFGEVYLLDWGLGYRMTEAPATQPLVGTPAYMAPEMLDENSARLGPCTDIYLLGAALHEVLTGRPKHQGANFDVLTTQIFASKPYAYQENVAAELAIICNKACHVEPEQRFQHVEELSEAIRDFLQHRASSQLTQATLKRLDDLRSIVAEDNDDTNTALYQAFNACQFGFEHAIQEWPNNTLAVNGLRETLIAMTEHTLRHEDLNTARGFASGLDPIPDALAEQIEALSEKLEAQKQHQHDLQKIAREYDTSIGRKMRWRIAWGTIATVVTAVSIGIFVNFADMYQFSDTFTILPPLGFLILASVGLFFMRDSLLSTKINRQIAFFGLVVVGSILINRLSGFLIGRVGWDTHIVDILILTTLSVVAAIMLHRFMWILAGIWSATFIAALALREGAMRPLMFSAMVLSVIAITIWFRRARGIEV